MALTAQDLVDVANAVGFTKDDLAKFFGGGSDDTRVKRLAELRQLSSAQFALAMDTVVAPAENDKGLPVPTFDQVATAFSAIK